MNPNELLSEYLQEVDTLAKKAEEAKRQLKQLSGSLTSEDGAVTLTVNAAGALQNLAFGPRADGMPKERLAQLILSTARRAQIQAAQQVTSILAPIVGEDSDAMRFVQEQIPVPEEPEGTPPTSDLAQPPIAYNEEQRYAQQQQQPPPPRFVPPPPMPQPQQQPQRPRHQRPEVDEDFGGPVTREEDW
ncbi:MAG TPA: YbaB/EbfC family nucleoid-associated protein [Pseudonocardiaceae bacterium]|nr:YbaB/EbfC family nucleoid-associated protein [Pseudonocardiaceae bacterium]